MAANLMPYTGDSSLPVSRPSYSKVMVTGLPLDSGLVESQPHGGIRLVAGCRNLPALVVRHTRDVERIVQLEGGRSGCRRPRAKTGWRLSPPGRLSSGVISASMVYCLHVDAVGAALLRGRGLRPGPNTSRPAASGQAERVRKSPMHVQLVPPEYLRSGPPRAAAPTAPSVPTCLSRPPTRPSFPGAPRDRSAGDALPGANRSPVICPCMSSGTTARPAIRFTME